MPYRYRKTFRASRGEVLLLSADPMHYSKVLAQLFQAIPGNWAGKAAIDIALMDWVGQKLGVPVY